ncbi:MAG: hypothetical protein DAHOPDDO_01748 [Ignavibacteriaceae bacterium]|nr:hypothetical protein [Ignavibacteriaceae bacterium]MCL4279609.1 hypothetical protein [Ignavibacteriaceae bacterium]
MKKLFYLLSALVIFSQFTVNAQDKGFGLGIILGEPTGVSAKLWTSSENSFDFAAAWSFQGDGHLLLQADYVWHIFRLIPVESGKLPFYVGVGGRVVFAEVDAVIGVRVPLGLDYMFSNAPVDIFVELVPILDLAPSTDFDFNGGIGARYWFN